MARARRCPSAPPTRGVKIPFPPGCQAEREDPEIHLETPLEQKGSILLSLSPSKKASPGEESPGRRGSTPSPQFFPKAAQEKREFGSFLFPPLSAGDVSVPMGSPVHSRPVPAAPSGEGRVITAGLICSSQTGCPSGPYLGPEEKIKADKAFALGLGRN